MVQSQCKLPSQGSGHLTKHSDVAEMLLYVPCLLDSSWLSRMQVMPKPSQGSEGAAVNKGSCGLSPSLPISYIHEGRCVPVGGASWLFPKLPSILAWHEHWQALACMAAQPWQTRLEGGLG